MSKRIIAFAASSSSRSINKQLVAYAAGLIEGIEVEILDLRDFELPLFSVDREDELGQPELSELGEQDLELGAGALRRARLIQSVIKEAE